MTKDQEASRWYAEQMGLLWDECHPVDYLSCVCSRGTKSCGVKHFTITDPACQMAIIAWCDAFYKGKSGLWSIEKDNKVGDGLTITEALVKLAERITQKMTIATTKHDKRMMTEQFAPPVKTGDEPIKCTCAEGEGCSKNCDRNFHKLPKSGSNGK